MSVERNTGTAFEKSKYDWQVGMAVSLYMYQYHYHELDPALLFIAEFCLLKLITFFGTWVPTVLTKANKPN
jgi:hypothetical protein